MNEQPQVPLDHRTRRRILRCLHEVRDTATADDLSTGLGIEATEVTYHAKVLVKYEMLKERRRGRVLADTRFESTVADDPDINALLNATECVDEG